MCAADLILAGANVITMDPVCPGAQIVAIEGDSVSSLGSGNDIKKMKGDKTRVIDCGGRTVLPGFNDAHCHVFSFVRKLLSLDLSPSAVRSIEDIKKIVGEKACNTPSGQWISGTDYNEFYLVEKRHPNRWDIDEAAPYHPVMLTHRSLHACVLNSPALALAGITRETEAPPGGFIERDINTGEPNGILLEMVGHIREGVISSLSEAEMEKGISLVNSHYLSRGVTSLQDATVVNDYNRWQKFSYLSSSDRLQSRLYMMFGMEAMERFEAEGLAYGAGDKRLRLGGLKIILSEATGELKPSVSELKRQVLAIDEAGFPVAIHAVEQRSVEAAISALEYIWNQTSKPRKRHRIEHCSHCPPYLLTRLKKLPAVIVTQSPFVYFSGERYLGTLHERHLRWLYPFRSLIDSGAIVADSSDCPVVPAEPLAGIYAAVTRQAESGQQLPPEESITVYEALAMNTINAAHASGEDTIKGSITPGKLADLVVLSDDPLKCPAGALKDIKVEMTLVGGKVVWEA